MNGAPGVHSVWGEKQISPLRRNAASVEMTDFGW